MNEFTENLPVPTDTSSDPRKVIKERLRTEGKLGNIKTGIDLEGIKASIKVGKMDIGATLEYDNEYNIKASIPVSGGTLEIIHNNKESDSFYGIQFKKKF